MTLTGHHKAPGRTRLGHVALELHPLETLQHLFMAEAPRLCQCLAGGHLKEMADQIAEAAAFLIRSLLQPLVELPVR